jgi:type II secretory pathway predicted ATPase ExeA
MTMDQEATQPDQDLGIETGHQGAADPGRRAVSSRRRALERLGAAVRDGREGPVLITGEPGAGKTWLAERLADELPAGWRALSVELTSALDALEFLRLVADALGLPMTERLGSVRLRIRAALEDDATDGRHWLLIVDEAHRGSPAVWEELHMLSSALGQPPGFSAIVVMGRTELARELATRRLDEWAIRLGLHVHLMPLDLDEARELLGFHGRAGCVAESALEELHRDALGNPRMLLRLADSRARAIRTDKTLARGRRPDPSNSPLRSAGRAPVRIENPVAPIRPASGSVPPEDSKPARAPSLIPSRPPIRLEDGLVEVGWDGDLEEELTYANSPPIERDASLRAESNLDEELVDDRYAALQAWTEWTRNRERSMTVEESPGGPASTSPDIADPDADESARDEPSADPGSTSDTPPASVRAETPHDFAPYSQLFTRLRQSRQG